MDDSVKYHITWDKQDSRQDSNDRLQRPITRLPNTVLSAGSAIYEFSRALTDFIFVEDPIEEADIIFVPGNGYPQMAEEAAVLYKKGYADEILPSGHFYIYDTAFDGVKARGDIYQGPYDTEWAFAKDVLIKNGVPERAVLCEDEARFTFENAIYSRRVLDAAGIEVKKAIICCLSAHARRCQMYYRLLFPKAKLMIHPVPANGISRDNWTSTPEGITIVTGETARCGQQFEDVLEDLRKAGYRHD